MSLFKDKTLMITGGTGSFGNAVLNRFLKTDIGEIRIFSRDEKKQDDMRHEFQAKMPEAADKIKFYIGDVIHPKSHSHSINTYEKSNNHLRELQRCVESTLDVIDGDTEKYLDLNRKFFRISFYRNAWNFGERTEMQNFESELHENNEFNVEHFFMKYNKKSEISDFLLRVISKIRRTVKK